MEQQSETPKPSPTPAALLMLARELRDAAVAAGRADVAAKADEAIVLLMGGGDSTGTAKGQQDGDKGDAVTRILNGLGF